MGATMTKLIINLKDGILDVDGSEEFVRSIYDDFKGEVAKRSQPVASAQRLLEQPVLTVPDGADNDGSSGVKKTRVKKNNTSGDGQKKASSKSKPTFDPNLDLKGLVEFYDRYAPQNVPEKILIFAMFLLEQLNLQSFSIDQIYTCFFTVRDRTKIPEAFAQAFHNTQARTHFIQITTLQEMAITTPGFNKFEEMKKSKAAA